LYWYIKVALNQLSEAVQCPQFTGATVAPTANELLKRLKLSDLYYLSNALIALVIVSNGVVQHAKLHEIVRFQFAPTSL